MQSLRYTSRGLRRRNNTDKWEATLSHVDPVTGETVRTFHTVDAKTKKGAEKARDSLIFKLESDDGSITVSHALDNGEGGFYLKEPKTGGSRPCSSPPKPRRPLPYTYRTAASSYSLRAVRPSPRPSAKESARLSPRDVMPFSSLSPHIITRMWSPPIALSRCATAFTSSSLKVADLMYGSLPLLRRSRARGRATSNRAASRKSTARPSSPIT